MGEAIVRKNEAGITLVELLATLVLMTIVTAAIWNAVFLSMKYTTSETTKVRLQQEANYIITKLQQQHRKLECYQLEITEDEIELFDCEKPKDRIEIISTDYKYIPVKLTKVEPKSDDLLLDLIIKDSKEDSKLKVEVSTIISRLKSKEPIGGNEDEEE